MRPHARSAPWFEAAPKPRLTSLRSTVGALDVLLDALEGVVGRGVVDEQELEARLGVSGESRDCAAGDLPAAVEHHHDR